MSLLTTPQKVPFQHLSLLTEHVPWPYSGACRRWCKAWHQNEIDNHELSEIISKNSLLKKRHKQIIQLLAMQNTNLRARNHAYGKVCSAKGNIYVLLFKTQKYS